MTNKYITFTSLMKEFEQRYDLHTVFNDLLSIVLSSVPHVPDEGDVYMAVLEKYKHDNIWANFPTLTTMLSAEMHQRISNGKDIDFLGDFFEQHLSKGTRFKPESMCIEMACMLHRHSKGLPLPLRVLDPACGSGRMLLASANQLGKGHYYLGIDTDICCVKMAVINMLHSEMFHGEVVWADSFDPDGFKESYMISKVPFGINKITDKSKSPTWNRLWGTSDLLISQLIQELKKESGNSQLALI